MLNGTLALHDIRDVEAFTASILAKAGIGRSHPDHEDRHAFLIAECWILSTRYNGSQGSRFSAWAKWKLGLALIDRHRQVEGRTRWQFSDRTYERPRPVLVPLDPDRTVTVDPEMGGLSDLMRLLRTGSSESTRPDAEVGAGQARLAA